MLVLFKLFNKSIASDKSLKKTWDSKMMKNIKYTRMGKIFLQIHVNIKTY